MKKFITFAVIVLSGLTIRAQESFTFDNTLDDTADMNINYSIASNHYLGEIIAKKMHLLKETYTYVEEGTPLSPGNKVIVRKPEIYYAVRKINKHYRKEIRKNRMEEATAIDKLGRILDICFAIYDQDTSEFEDYLSNYRKVEDIEKVFENVELQ